jgi:hypothetical protein
MDDMELFEQGCFLPEWVTDDREETKVSQAFTRQHKDLPTLLNELDEIKEKIQEIQARQWILARKIYFHDHNLAEQ